MKVVWANEPPVTTNIIMEQLGTEKGGKHRLLYPLCSGLQNVDF